MDLIDWYRRNDVPFARLLGIEVDEAGPERVVGSLQVASRLCTVRDVAHGGAIVAFADTLGALATLAHVPRGGTTSTLESKTSFVAPAPAGARLVGRAEIVHRGRSTVIWLTRVSTEEGRLVALTTQTQWILPGPGGTDD